MPVSGPSGSEGLSLAMPRAHPIDAYKQAALALQRVRVTLLSLFGAWGVVFYSRFCYIGQWRGVAWDDDLLWEDAVSSTGEMEKKKRRH